jgi:outer membrane protein assembly factor BamB
MRFLLFLAGLMVSTLTAHGQTYTRGTIPEKSTLDRLNLKNEWAIAIPVASRHDGIGTVQVVDENQMFVQTKSGVLVAIDASTGRQQWNFRHPTDYPTLLPVAVNRKYVFLISVAKLYCLNRETGGTELEYDLPAAPATGPTVDFEQVYITYTSKSIQTLALPPNMRSAAAPQALKAQLKEEEQERLKRGGPVVNPVDDVAKKYATRYNAPQPVDGEIDEIKIPKGYLGSDGGGDYAPRENRPPLTPSLAATSSVLPPYNLGGLNKVESIQIIPSLRRPYQLKPDYMRYNQISPSIGAIPPSVAKIHELANLRPPPLEPTKRWVYTTGGRVFHEPVLVGEPVSEFLWITTDNKTISAVNAIEGPDFGSPDIRGEMNAPPAAALSRPLAITKDTIHGFLPLTDGELIAIDLRVGSIDAERTVWRSNVGGLNNHRPIVTKHGVYASGDQTGVVRVDVATGDVVWRTDRDANTILAWNEEHMYIRDKRGQLLVYEIAKNPRPTTEKSRPIASMDISNLNVVITNDITDRIFLSAQNGLLVCLRENVPKYAKPLKVQPASQIYEEPKPPMPMMPPGQ